MFSVQVRQLYSYKKGLHEMRRHLYYYDVVVVGGGAAGIAAAIGSSKAGAKTLLLERNPYFGGQATHSNVAFYCGFFTSRNPPVQIVGGVGNMVLEKLRELGEYDGYLISPTGNAVIPLDPEALKYALDCLMTDSSADFLLYAHVIGVEKEADRIVRLECMDDEGRFYVEGKAFVDATGDANLAFLAGADLILATEGQAQVCTLMMRVAGIGEDADLSPAALQTALRAAKADGMKYLTKEKGIMIRRKPGDDAFAVLPSVQVLSLDAETLTQAELNVRRQAQEYIKAFRRYLPGMENCRLVATGPRLGIRESRRLVGETMLTGEAVLRFCKSAYAIARGGWPPEIHSSPDKMAEYLGERVNNYYDIPIGAIKSANISNLWCGGRTISADPVAFASVRVMGTAFATGHAAGVAAALTGDSRRYDIQAIQQELKKQGAIL